MEEGGFGGVCSQGPVEHFLESKEKPRQNRPLVLMPEATTIDDLVFQWNESLETRKAQVKEFNKDIIQRFNRGELRPECVEAALEPEPERLKPPGRDWCYHWRQQWGWATLTRSADSQAWLPFHHPDMEEARRHVNSLPEEVEGGLILNFDQVWRQSHATHRYKLCFKPRHLRGKRAKKVRPHPTLDKKAHVVKNARKGLTVSGACRGPVV